MPPDNEVGPRGKPEGTDNIHTTSHRQEAGYPHYGIASRQCGAETVRVVAYDWRAANRTTEHTTDPVDAALTATGLAHEIRLWLERL